MKRLATQRRGRLRGYGVQGMRMCLVLDALRKHAPRAIDVRVIAKTMGVHPRTIRRDVAALARLYPVHIGQGHHSGDKGCNYAPGVVWHDELNTPG